MRPPPTGLEVVSLLVSFDAIPANMVQAIVCADGFNNVLRLPVASFATMNFVLWHGHYSPADTDSDRRASPVYLCAYLSLAFLTDRSHYVFRFTKRWACSHSIECLCAGNDFDR